MNPRLVLIGAALVYLAVTGYAISQNVSHFELWGVLLQFILLLPALWLVLRDRTVGDSPFSFSEVPGQKWMALLLVGFSVVALPFSYWIGRAVVFADETSYQFQALAFDHSELMAEPPPGAKVAETVTPEPIAFKHLVVSRKGWFTKYPIGWPLVLAVGEKVNLGWAVNPVLGIVFLLLIGAVAHEAYGRGLAFPALWMAVLSPYLLSYTTGRMSHGLCAVLITAAALFCVRALRTPRTSDVVLMFVALILSFHVRPYTAFLVAPVMGLALLLKYWRDRPVFVRLLLIAGVAGVVAVGSVLFYNWAYTGKPLLSPYALYDRTETPTDVTLNPRTMLKVLTETRRFSVQTTLLYSFPLVFLSAAIGVWKDRHSAVTRMLAVLFPVVFLGYLAQPFGSSPIVGERYYFEVFFSAVVLAAVGLQRLVEEWRSLRFNVMWAAAVLTVVQIGLTALAADQIERVGRPYQEISAKAHSYADCNCVVFLRSTEDHVYFSPNLNLNRPDWRRAHVFYFNDPGEGERPEWATKLGWRKWVVLTYDEGAEQARVLQQGVVE